MRRSLCILLVLTVLMQTASAQDPFGLLFGDESNIETGNANDPGKDDLLLVSLRLGQIRFGGNVPAFRTGPGVCVVAADFVDAIEAPVEVRGHQIDGWYLEPGRRFFLDAEENVLRIAGRELVLDRDDAHLTGAGLCLSLRSLRRLFAADFTFIEADLTIDILPHELWPIEARLEREKARERLLGRDVVPPNYRSIDNPTRWLSWPTVDLALASGIGGRDRRLLDGDAAFVGDVLHLTGRMQTVRDENGRRDVRLSLLGNPGAVSVALGDIAAPALPLLDRGDTGRGFSVGSQNSRSGADVLGSRDIRGALPPGWEAELHDEQGLVAFATEPDANGEYFFEAVPLRPGYNRLSVKLFGPHGETRERPIRTFLGQELNPENTVRWDLAAMQAGRSLSGEETSADPVLIGRGRVSYGIHSQATLRVDMAAEQNEQAFVAPTLLASLGPVLSDARLAYGSSGGAAFETGLQARLGERHAFTARFLDGGGLENRLLGFGPQRIDQAVSMRIEGPFSAFGYRLPLTARFDGEIREGGLEGRRFGVSTGGRVGGLTLRKAVQYSEQSAGFQEATTDVTGNVLVGGRLLGQRLRTAVGYRCAPECSLNNLTVTAQSRLRSDINLGVTALYDADRGGGGFGLNLSKAVGHATGRFDLGHDPVAGWRVGFGLRFSLYRMPGEGLRVGPHGMTQSGTLVPRVFEDIDGDGNFAEADRPLPGASFVLGGSLRSAETNVSGVATLDRIATGALSSLELKRSSLPDPFLMPLEAGREVRLRPGQILAVDMPVRQTGEAELTVVLRRDGLVLPVAGLLVEARDGDGLVVGRARTAYDGSVYLGDLPLTDLTFSLAERAVAELGARSEPVTASLTRAEPYAGGLELVIEMPSP